MPRFGVSDLTTATFKDELHNSFPLFNDENDVGFLMELLYYFPMDKVYIAAGSYDQYLYDLQKTVIDNYENGNFQVSYFYAHLIFMSYVYYCVERAYQIQPNRMKDIFYPINAYFGNDDKPSLETYTSIYDFSKIPEKEIFKVFRIMGMEHQQIKDLSKYISKRDNFAHATGKGNISEETLIQNVRTIKGNMEALNELFRPAIRVQYIEYLLEYTEYDYETVIDSAYDFMLDHFLSLRDIEYLCNMGISRIRNENELFKERYRFIKKVHCAFIEYCVENEGIDEPAGYIALRDQAYLFYKYHGKATEYIENELGIRRYLHVKDGGEFPVYECPSCEQEQLVYDSDNNCYHCFSCDTDFNDEDLSFCERCGCIMRREDKVGICQNCIDHYTKEE